MKPKKKVTPRSSLPNIMAHMGDILHAHARTKKALSQSSHVSYGARSLGASPHPATSHDFQFIVPKPLRAKGVIAQARPHKDVGSENEDFVHTSTIHPSEDMSREKRMGKNKMRKKGRGKKDGEGRAASVFVRSTFTKGPPALSQKDEDMAFVEKTDVSFDSENDSLLATPT